MVCSCFYVKAIVYHCSFAQLAVCSFCQLLFVHVIRVICCYMFNVTVRSFVRSFRVNANI